MQYDELGNLGLQSDYNQAGLRAKTTQPANSLWLTHRYSYDGDGQRVYSNSYYHSQPHTPPPNDPSSSQVWTSDYLIHSTVLGGQVVASFSLGAGGLGYFSQSYYVGIFFGGGRIAESSYGYDVQSNVERKVAWVYDNPVTGSRYKHIYKSYGGAPFINANEDS